MSMQGLLIVLVVLVFFGYFLWDMIMKMFVFIWHEIESLWKGR